MHVGWGSACMLGAGAAALGKGPSSHLLTVVGCKRLKLVGGSHKGQASISSNLDLMVAGAAQERQHSIQTHILLAHIHVANCTPLIKVEDTAELYLCFKSAVAATTL